MKALKIIGCILAGVQFILAAVLVYLLIRTQLIPQRYIIMGALTMGLLPICFIAMQLKKVTGAIASVLSMIICGVLVFGIIKVNQTDRMLDEVTGNKTEVEVVNVYISKDDPVDTINKATDKGYVFGVIKSDRKNVDKTIEELNGQNSSPIKTEEYDSITKIAEAFEKGKVNGFIINSGSLGILEGEAKYKDYSKNLKIIHEQKIESELNNQKNGNENADKFCIYISGIDTYGDVTLKSRSDVNIIAVVNTKTHTILLLSTPRDYYVKFADDSVEEPYDKLTHAGVFGIDMSMATLGNLYGVDIDYYVRVNFTGFENIIDTLGGVDVDSDYEFTSQLNSIYSYEKGRNHLTGEAALFFARERYSFLEGDRQRGKNQMAVIKAVMNKLLSSELLKNYSDLMAEMKDSFQTNMTKAEIGKLVQDQLDGGESWTIVQYSANGGDSKGYCYSLGYVMEPYYDTVEYASELIKRVLNDEVLTQNMINREAPKYGEEEEE